MRGPAPSCTQLGCSSVRGKRPLQHSTQCCSWAILSKAGSFLTKGSTQRVQGGEDFQPYQPDLSRSSAAHERPPPAARRMKVQLAAAALAAQQTQQLHLRCQPANSSSKTTAERVCWAWAMSDAAVCCAQLLATACCNGQTCCGCCVRTDGLPGGRDARRRSHLIAVSLLLMAGALATSEAPRCVV